MDEHKLCLVGARSRITVMKKMLREIIIYLKWMINPCEKEKEWYILASWFGLAVLSTGAIYLLSRVLASDVLKDLLTGIGALVIAAIAISGINTWKKQLKGKTDYEIARDYLRAAIKVKNAIDDLRNPGISIGEQKAAREKYPFSDDNYITEHQKDTRAVYSVRWDAVRDAWEELDRKIIEAEISWDVEAIECSRPLIADIRKIYSEVWMFVSGYGKPINETFIYNAGSFETPDEFSIKVNSDLKKIRKFVEPYL